MTVQGTLIKYTFLLLWIDFESCIVDVFYKHVLRVQKATDFIKTESVWPHIPLPDQKANIAYA